LYIKKHPQQTLHLEKSRSPGIQMFCLMHRESKRAEETEVSPEESDVKGMTAEGIHIENE